MTAAASSPHATSHHVSIVIPVYRNADQAVALAHALQIQRLPAGTNIEIIIVDDGSNDGSADRMEESIGKQVVLHRLPTNNGRAITRNRGAAQASGELLLFMDCDCLPADAGFIAAHLRRFDADVVASTGPVVGTGQGFWHDYQARSSARRAALHARGIGCAGSTQNLMVRRDRFKAVGGFDEDYRAYGFEDRDLLIRLGQLGSIAWAQDAIVEHHDDLDLATVCRKMREAGAGGSAIFSARHPEAYRALGYAGLDGTFHPNRGRLAQAFKPLLPPTLSAASALLEQRWIPLTIRAGLVKGLSGFSYLLGTTEATGAPPH